MGYIQAMSEPALPLGSGPEITVPESWKRATLGAPVPVVRCTYIFPDTHARPGEQCGKWSLRGALKCVKHGGQLENVRKHAEAVVEAARLRLIGDTDLAVDVIEDLMRNGTSEAVKLKAATEVLDRSGVRGGVELDVTVNENTNPADVLRDRIREVRERVVDITDTTTVTDPAEPGDTVDTTTESADAGDPPHEE